MHGKELIHQYFLGNLDAASVDQLNEQLKHDAALRREFLNVANLDAALREASIERSIDEVNGRLTSNVNESAPRYTSLWIFSACVAIAASILLAIGIWVRHDATLAVLVSSEDAAWESSLPTSEGSELAAGVLHLKTGIATIEFRSGAEMTVEAPASLELMSAMRAKLTSGAAVLNVPESATGFVLETPDGYAVDFGTRFAVTIDDARRTTDFELIEGEIEVHHAVSGASLRLNDIGAAASVSNDSLRLIDDVLSNEPSVEPAEHKGRVISIATNGRCGVALHNEKRRKKAIRKGYLYASHTRNGQWDMRSYIAFDLSSINREQLIDATLRINQVQSYRGSASLLPKTNQFAIYGLTNAAKADWDLEPTWDESPTPDDGELVGTFELPRSRMRGIVEIDTPELLSFLKAHDGESVTLILTRQSGRIDGAGPAMPHMFASDQHPEAVGPQLELTIK